MKISKFYNQYKFLALIVFCLLVMSGFYYILKSENRRRCSKSKIYKNDSYKLCYDNVYSKSFFRKFMPGSDAEISAYYEIIKNNESFLKFERGSCPLECGDCHYDIGIDTITDKYIFLVGSYGTLFRLPNVSKGASVKDISVYNKRYYLPYFLKTYSIKINKDTIQINKGDYSIDSLDFYGIPKESDITPGGHCLKDWNPWF